MRRKKVESEPDFIDAIPELVENEQFVIEDTRKIRKEKTVPVEADRCSPGDGRTGIRKVRRTGVFGNQLAA